MNACLHHNICLRTGYAAYAWKAPTTSGLKISRLQEKALYCTEHLARCKRGVRKQAACRFISYLCNWWMHRCEYALERNMIHCNGSTMLTLRRCISTLCWMDICCVAVCRSYQQDAEEWSGKSCIGLAQLRPDSNIGAGGDAWRMTKRPKPINSIGPNRPMNWEVWLGMKYRWTYDTNCRTQDDSQ